MNEHEHNSRSHSHVPASPAPGRQSSAAYDDPIDLIELCYMLLRHSVTICVCAMVCAVAAFAYTYLAIPATYKATAKLYVVSASKDSVINLSDIQIGTQLTADYRELILGRTILKETISKLGLNWSPEKLMNSVSITNPNNTRILRITATTTDPQLAADIANEIAQQTMECLPRIMACETPNVAEIAEVPKQKSGPGYMQNTLQGALIGAVLAAAFFCLRFLLNDSIVSPEDVTNYLQLDTLAVIPEETDNRKNRDTKKQRSKHRKT